MKVLVIGSGAREHALVNALAADPQVRQIHAAPGNAGMGATAQLHPVEVGDADAIAELAVSLDVDLVVVGPEVPLVAGAADAVRGFGIACFGPSAQAAQLEASKAYAKRIMHAAGVPTGRSGLCTGIAAVATALDEFGAPYVVKDDGLAAGKGVVVTADREQALAHARDVLAKQGGRVIVEEYLAGPEVSLFCVTDGTTVVALQPAQDFKRVGDGDTGPNTGGMGAYTPLPWAPPDLVEEVLRTVAQPTVDEMRAQGTPFAGLLYVGLALTPAGVRVIEFNARFGDPETQVVLAVLETPLAGLLHAAATGRLAEHEALRWHNGAAVTVVIAAQGYPASPTTGDVILGIEAAQALPGVQVLHAGTGTNADGDPVSAGGRVLSVVARGSDLADARARAYEGVELIKMRGSHYRTDIALAAARGEVVVPSAADDAAKY
ncbi:MAG: phosphoribosylamine--glycine ligase, partial [Actinomycetes bacterium]